MDPEEGACPCESCRCGKVGESALAMTSTLLNSLTTAWHNFEAQFKAILANQQILSYPTNPGNRGSQIPVDNGVHPPQAERCANSCFPNVNFGTILSEEIPGISELQLCQLISRLPPGTTVKRMLPSSAAPASEVVTAMSEPEQAGIKDMQRSEGLWGKIFKAAAVQSTVQAEPRNLKIAPAETTRDHDFAETSSNNLALIAPPSPSPRFQQAPSPAWLNQDSFDFETDMEPVDLSVINVQRIYDVADESARGQDHQGACVPEVSQVGFDQVDFNRQSEPSEGSVPTSTAAIRRSLRPKRPRINSLTSDFVDVLQLLGYSDSSEDEEESNWVDEAVFGNEYLNNRENKKPVEEDQSIFIATRANSRGSNNRSTSFKRGRPCKIYRCTECPEMCEGAAAFELHLRTHDPKNPYKCGICATRFETLKSRNKHLQGHRDATGAYNCAHCEKSFTQSNHLKEHVRIHTGERPYECDTCQRSFLRSVDLDAHRKTHFGENPYQCNECSAGFKTSSELFKHSRIHTGVKPYKCSHCPMAFKRSSNLRVHNRIHTGEKPYQCNQCPKAFAQISNLQQHKRNHHRIRNSIDPDQLPIVGSASNSTVKGDNFESSVNVAEPVVQTPAVDYSSHLQVSENAKERNQNGGDYVQDDVFGSNCSYGKEQAMELPIKADRTVDDFPCNISAIRWLFRDDSAFDGDKKIILH